MAKSKLVAFRIPEATYSMILESLAKAGDSSKHEAVATVSDWLNKAIVEKLNHAQRSKGSKGSLRFINGESRRGRPVKALDQWGKPLDCRPIVVDTPLAEIYDMPAEC